MNSSRDSDLPQPLFIGIGQGKSSSISAGRAHEFISIASRFATFGAQSNTTQRRVAGLAAIAR